MSRIPFLVRISRPLLKKLQRRYGMPDLGNAFDELVARSVCAESARQIANSVPIIQDADTAKGRYDLQPFWISMKKIPEFRLKMDQAFLKALSNVPDFADCKTYQEIFYRLLDRGLWGEAQEKDKHMMVPGFGNIGGLLDIKQKETEDKIDVELG
jgi:hypothetical protein